ncbi:MAG: hypothetical protein M3273_08940 [Actinomycetota bacterium]|nr:hypothetical protein [Actinomycetota bacterium]
MPRRLLALLPVLVAAAACRPDTVDLFYRFSEGTVTYRMEATATARWDIGGRGEGSYRVVFDVSEDVTEETGGTARVRVVMTPVHVEEDDLPAPADERSFALRVDRNGGVLQVLQVDGADVADLDPNELALIGTYRPPLALDPVALGDTWLSEQEVEAGDSFQQLVTLGELDSLYRDADGPVARLAYEGDGPLLWATDLPQGRAELRGAAETRGTADVAIEEGSLRSATSTFRGDFDVRVVPAGGTATPLTGTLRLDLELAVERRE